MVQRLEAVMGVVGMFRSATRFHPTSRLRLGSGVSVLVGMFVAVLDGVAVTVGVLVGVAVTVGVLVGVAVTVGVLV